MWDSDQSEYRFLFDAFSLSLQLEVRGKYVVVHIYILIEKRIIQSIDG